MKVSGKVWQWAIEQHTIKFWWRSGSRIRIRIFIRIGIRIATLVRRTLAEVCTISVLLVIIIILIFYTPGSIDPGVKNKR